MLKQIKEIHHTARPDLFKSGLPKYSVHELEERIADKTTPIFVYEENGKVLAHIFCTLKKSENDSVLNDMTTLFINDFCVDKSLRGTGIGTKMYTFVRNFAKNAGCYHINLNVWECNPSAKKFYTTLGMKPQSCVMEDIL